MRRCLKLIGLVCLIAERLSAAPDGLDIAEDFSRPPLDHGWQTSGEASLFSWNSTAENLSVTWDSSRPNSYFYSPLRHPLTRADSFGFAFDLVLDQIEAGLVPGHPFTFEVAVGLINLRDAASPAFRRGTGSDSPNILEFDYFPEAAGITPTFALTLVSTNGQFLFSHNFPVVLDTGASFHFEIEYAQAKGRVEMTVTRNGAPFGPMAPILFRPEFTDFALDALAISSYSHEGADGSILARGVIDNLKLFSRSSFTIDGLKTEGGFEVRMESWKGWTYSLEKSADLQSWTAVSSIPGTGERLTLSDPLTAIDHGFYRVRAVPQ